MKYRNKFSICSLCGDHFVIGLCMRPLTNCQHVDAGVAEERVNIRVAERATAAPERIITQYFNYWSCLAKI